MSRKNKENEPNKILKDQAAEENSEKITEETTEETTEKSTDPERTEEAGEKKERELKWAKEADKEEPTETAEDASQKAIAEANDRYTRLFAEFDNYRKRTEKEKTMRFDMGVKDMVEKVLPVLDSFELALKNIPEGEKDSPFVDGMDKIHKQFLKALEDAGVTPIDAVGKEFNPEFHNAVLIAEGTDAEPDTVVEELQKGYMYKDTVVRYSMVKVAK